jgi:ActR/RegA family two-component response regulator
MAKAHDMVATKLALLLDDNLMSAVRVQAQLERIGYRVQTARNLPNDEGSKDMLPELVVINLGSRGMNAVGFISACRERFPTSRVIGFCGHLEVEIRRAAKAAAIDKILTNDQAYSELAKSL